MPDLLPNESIILTDQAFIKKHPRSGWKPGHLALTNKRLVLRQPARDIFEMFLEAISSVATEKKGFILRSVDALCVTFVNPPKSDSARLKSRPSDVPSRFKHPSRVWIVVKNAQNWQKEIFNRTKLQVSEDDIEKIAAELGPESQSILFHIWEARHATIQELAKLYDAPNHMEVLHRIRNIMNPVSEKVVGFPILVFERSKIIDPAVGYGHNQRNLVNVYERSKADPVTGGEKVLFSWWITGEREAKKESIKPLMDLFDEEDHIVFVMELRGVEEKDIEVTIDGDHLKLSCDSPDVNFSEDILLPSVVDPGTIEKRYRNGILEVKLRKSLTKMKGRAHPKTS
ncbi:Hsp20 family protein [Acidobacteria bacterium AH-259-O06]|nr:Hsp20 family protein [Acidobacteria bacterium AH-259-O06]